MLKKNKLIKIDNYKTQDYIELHGIMPVMRRGRSAYYENDYELLDLLDSWVIENFVQPNKTKSLDYGHIEGRNAKWKI